MILNVYSTITGELEIAQLDTKQSITKIASLEGMVTLQHS